MKLRLYILIDKQRYYFKDDSLPYDRKMTDKATREADKYLKNLAEGNYDE